MQPIPFPSKLSDRDRLAYPVNEDEAIFIEAVQEADSLPLAVRDQAATVGPERATNALEEHSNAPKGKPGNAIQVL